MIPRTLRPVLRAAARQYPVVTLTGPRQSGKTSLLRDAFPRHDYISLEEPDQNKPSAPVAIIETAGSDHAGKSA